MNKDVENFIENAIIYTNLESEISITFPAKLMRETLSEEEIKAFFDGLMPIINLSLLKALSQ